MILKKVKLRKLYTKIAVKTPILVLTVVVITSILLYYFLATSTIGLFKKCEVVIKTDEFGEKYIETKINLEYADSLNKNSRVFWYVNREESIYNAFISKIDKHDFGLRLTILSSDKDKSILDKVEKLYVEIEISQQTLLGRLFKKGINNNEAR